jgi:hypothetical protein
MGDRLRDYGFMNPFRSHVQGSNYGASKAYLSGGGIDQWLTDVSTYNKVLTDFGIQSQIEYKQPNGSWSTTPPANAKADTITYFSASRGGTSSSAERYEIGAPKVSGQYGASTGGQAITTLPEYRWRITGDVAGANSALKAAGLQGSYTTPRGEQSPTGAYLSEIVNGKSVVAEGKRSNYGGPRQSQTYYLNAGDPLGAGLDGASDAQGRLSGGATPTFRYSPLSTTAQNFWSTTHDIAKEFFSDPNVAPIKTDPTRLNQVLSATPQIRDTIGTYINDTASYWRSRDDGGGALGVIAAGLSGVAQFAAMASGLHGLMAGLGGLASGAGLTGAIKAGMSAAGGMPDIGSVVGGAIGGGPAVGNLVNVGVGGITGGAKGGLPGAALGAGGAAIGAGIDQAGGVKEFIKNPFQSLGGAFGLGGNGFTAAQIAAMEKAAQVGPGSLAENIPASATGERLPLPGGGWMQLPARPGEILSVGIGPRPSTSVGIPGAGVSTAGSNLGGALGSISSNLAGSLFGGGPSLSGAPSMGLLSPNLAGGQATPSTGGAGTGQGGSNIISGNTGGLAGGIQTSGGMPSGGMTEEQGLQSGQDKKFDAINAGLAMMYGMPWNFTGATNPVVAPGMGSAYDEFIAQNQFGSEGTTSDKDFGAGSAGLLAGVSPWDFMGADTGIPGMPTGTSVYGSNYAGGTGGTGAGGEGMGGDGLGGDGLGLDGMGGGGGYMGLLSGMTPGSMGEPFGVLQGGRVGSKKKAGQSFYSPVKSPKRRKGITVRRA